MLYFGLKIILLHLFHVGKICLCFMLFGLTDIFSRTMQKWSCQCHGGCQCRLASLSNRQRRTKLSQRHNQCQTSQHLHKLRRTAKPTNHPSSSKPSPSESNSSRRQNYPYCRRCRRTIQYQHHRIGCFRQRMLQLMPYPTAAQYVFLHFCFSGIVLIPTSPATVPATTNPKS